MEVEPKPAPKGFIGTAPLEQGMKLLGGAKGKNLLRLGRLDQKEKDSNASAPQPWANIDNTGYPQRYSRLRFVKGV
jgi:hypothetical protein